MLIATKTAVYRLESATEDPQPHTLCEGRHVDFIAEGWKYDVLVTGGDRIEIWQDEDFMPAYTGIVEPISSVLIVRENPLELLIGTEGAHLYHLDGPAGPARRVTTFDRLDVRRTWHTPWGGPPAIRSFAAVHDGTVYADIHVGSIMRSDDWGEDWRPVTPQLDEDVHQVSVCPLYPARVYANTAKAVYISADRGTTWEYRGQGLGGRYGRAIAIHPTNPEVMLASVSDGPHDDEQDVHGQLYWTGDCGISWTHIAEGFPAVTRKNINTYHLCFSPLALAWAAVDATLYIGRNRGQLWEPFWVAPEKIEMITARF